MVVVWFILAIFTCVLVMEVVARLIVIKYKYIFNEFPVFDSKILSKFVNYDAELGWEPRPASSGPDIGELRPNVTIDHEDAIRKAKSYYTINSDGSRKQPAPSVSLVGPHIEIFGDSACMCREVEDNETFPFFLEEEHKLGPCRNFGVGNYGSDQAVLRANRRMVGGGIAILFVTLKSLERNTAVYKHYSEPGNYWAVKPRFLINERGLELIPRPFVDREGLENLALHKEYFHLYDKHYEKFLAYTPIGNWSYFLHFIKNEYTINILWKRIQRDSKLQFSPQFIRYVNRLGRLLHRLLPYPRREHNLYSRLAQGEEGNLFALIAKRFSDLSASRGSSSLIVLTPQGEGVSDPEDYGMCVQDLTQWCQKYGVRLYDFGEELFGLDQVKLQEFNAYSNHMSKVGNSYLAAWLAKKIKEQCP